MVGVFEQGKVKCRWSVQKRRLGRLGTWLGRIRLIILVSLDCMLIEISFRGFLLEKGGIYC